MAYNNVESSSNEPWIYFSWLSATGVPSFNAYDHGPWINLRRYGTTSPLAYNLRLVTAPVYIFWSENDLIVTPKDVAWLTANLGNVKGSFRVADPLFNHFDYVLGMNVNQVLNYPILRLMPPPWSSSMHCLEELFMEIDFNSRECWISFKQIPTVQYKLLITVVNF